MVLSNKTFRVFVSSTFADLVEERNALQREVFPKLRELCMEHGFRFQAIDLRWGVSEEAALDQQTMKICLEEIERSQKVSPKPNFIVLLGDRYGWQPLPYEIPADEFEEIKSVIHDESDRKFLFWEGKELDDAQLKQREGWYCKDENSVPPVYCLKPRIVDYSENDSDDEIKDAQEEEAKDWEKKEKKIKSLLSNAIEELGWDPKDERKFKYETSATEQEIIKGVLNPPKDIPHPEEHVFCFFREIENKEKVPYNKHSKDFFDFNEKNELDKSSEKKLKFLKTKIEDKLPSSNIFDDYLVEWEGETPNDKHINKLCVDVYLSLEKVIKEQTEEFKERNPLDVEIEAHIKFGKDLLQFFLGREKNRDKIKTYLQTPNSKPLIIYGESGSGKSALIAKSIEDSSPIFYRKEGGDLYQEGFIVRFIGATPESSDIRSLLESLSRQITQIYKEDDSNIPSKYNELVQDFKKRLKLATPEKPLFIFLDALDQLSDFENAQNLAWIPGELPENVHIILSTLKKQFQDLIENKIPNKNTAELESLNKMEGKSILNSWFNEEIIGRKLTKKQKKEVISKFEENGLPLYLKMAFEEAILWKSYTPTPDLRPDLSGIINSLFERLSQPKNHGKLLVSHSLGYLLASKNGLSEDEMLDILALDAEVFSLTKKFHNPPEEKLPVALWSRLYFDLEPYLTEKSADGTLLLGFYHRQLVEVLSKIYLNETVKKERHKLLAKYFQDKNLSFDRRGEYVYNIRKVSELPFQQTNAELWDKIERTLTDLHFIEAKCMVGMTYSLIEDYNRLGINKYISIPIVTPYYFENKFGFNCPFCIAWSTFKESEIGKIINCPHCSMQVKIKNIIIKSPWHISPPKKEIKILLPKNKELKDLNYYSQFIKKNKNLISKFPDLTLQFAANQQDKSQVAIKAKLLLQKTGKKWLERINKDYKLTEEILTLIGHTGPIKFCTYTPDGSKIISASNLEIKIWNSNTGNEIINIANEGKFDIKSYDITFDGLKIASGSLEGNIKIWDINSGLLLYSVNISDRIKTVKFSLDGNQLIALSEEEVYFINLNDKKQPINFFQNKKNRDNKFLTYEYSRLILDCYCLSPDGSRLIVGIHLLNSSYIILGYFLIVIDINSGDLIKSINETDKIILCSYSPDNNKVLITLNPRKLKILESNSLKMIKTFEMDDYYYLNNVIYSQDGSNILAEYGPDLVFLDSDTGELTKKIDYKKSIKSLKISPDGESITTLSEQDYCIWDTYTGMIRHKINEDPSCYNYSPDGSRLITGGSLSITDGQVKVWDAHLTNETETHDGPVTLCDFSPDGSRLATTSISNIKIWDTENGFQINSKDCIYHLKCIQYSPGGSKILLGTMDGAILLLNAFSLEMTLKMFHERPWENCYLDGCFFSPDGSKIASLVSSHVLDNYSSSVKVWDAYTGKEIISLENEYIERLSFSHDGSKLVTGSSMGDMIIRNSNNGNQLLKINCDNDLRSLSFSNDSSRIIAGFYSGKITIWDAKTGSIILKLFQKGLDSCNFSPESSHILALSHYHADSTKWSFLNIYDSKKGKKIKRLLHPDCTSFMVINSKIISKSMQEIKIWNLESFEQIANFVTEENLWSYSIDKMGKKLVLGCNNGHVNLFELK